MFEFPFAVPEDFAATSSADLRATLRATIDFSSQFSALPADQHTPESDAALTASAELAARISAVLRTRKSATTAAAALAELAADVDDDADDEGEGDGDGGDAGEAGDGDTGGGEDTGGESVTASSGVVSGTVIPAQRPSVRQLGNRPATDLQLPNQGDRKLAVMRIASEAPGFYSGQELTTFAEASTALSGLLNRYPTMTAGRATFHADKRPVTVYDPKGRRLTMKNFTRHNGIEFARNFPEELRVAEGRDGYSVAEFAANEKRLAGGGLIQSAKRRVKAGRSLTAAAAWCAVSEVIYQLCELESMDGILSVPELQTSRGGWQIPIDGGPNFASIWNGIGNAGDTHLSETDVQDDVQKVCTEIPCPDFEDVRLGVDYVCLTGGLLQRRGYPEIVSRFSRGAMVALAHKINQGVIAQMEAASGAPIQIPQVVNGDDAASALLSAVELAITDIKYANRMTFGGALEVVMPMWFLAPIRAGIARRRGVLALSVSDSEILDWFAIRKASPQFVYDWQDAYTDLPLTGPGGAAPIDAFPTSGRFMVYPSGTWVKAVQDVVNLDTIYDSTNLQTNQYTAIFAEDGWAMLQMCPDSRVYEVALDTSGVVGCCPPELISF
jgi:hypothetical protein